VRGSRFDVRGSGFEVHGFETRHIRVGVVKASEEVGEVKEKRKVLLPCLP
jgi:hypothetical protein